MKHAHGLEAMLYLDEPSWIYMGKLSPTKMNSPKFRVPNYHMNGWRFPKIIGPSYVKLVGKPSTKFSKISNASPIFDMKNISGNSVKPSDLIYIMQPGVPPQNFPRKSSFLRYYFHHLNKALPTSARGLRGMISSCVSTSVKVLRMLWCLCSSFTEWREDESPIQMSHTPCPRCWREKG